MKRLTFIATLVTTVGTAAAPLSAQTLEDFFDGKQYTNRGQCEAALVRERNDRRVNDGNTGSYTDPEYNRVVNTKYECIEVVRGTWIVVVSGD